MLTIDQKSKLYKKYKKLADFIVENDIEKKDILELMLEDPSFQRHRDIVQGVSDYFEWRIHPKIPKVACSTMGDITISGEPAKIIESGGELKIFLQVSPTKEKKVSAAALILGTFQPMPDDGGKYTPRYRNENFKDLRISNLYWYRLVE